MQPSSNAVLQAQAIKPNPSRAIEIGIAPDGTSVSIVARRPGAGAVEIVLPSEEIPPLIGALLRTTGLSQRATGNYPVPVLPIEERLGLGLGHRIRLRNHHYRGHEDGPYRR